MGAADPTPGQPQNTATAQGGETVGSAPRLTGLPGVMLANRVAGAGGAALNVSGTLIDYGKNIHLDGGTQMVLGVIAQ
jgi:hypothetical protein